MHFDLPPTDRKVLYIGRFRSDPTKTGIAGMRPIFCCPLPAMILVAFGLCAFGKSQDSNVTQTFDISELNARLKNEAGLSQEQCSEWLESRVRPLIRFDGIQPAIQTQTEIEGVKLVSDSTRLLSSKTNSISSHLSKSKRKCKC